MARTIAKVTWNGDRIERGMREGAESGVKAAALHLKAKLQENLGTQGPPRSLPGNFPHMDTGELHDTTTAVADLKRLSWRVVMRAQHAIHLEFGTVNMAPRPFARRTMDEEKATLSKIVQDHIKPAIGRYL